jgi:hypothetical protein
MKSQSTLRSVMKFARLTIVVGALSYAAWQYWQQQNQAGAAVWAAGTDRID